MPIVEHWCGVLGMSEFPTPAGLDTAIKSSLTVGWAANQVAMDAETRLATLGFAQVLATRQPIAVPGADCVDGRPMD